MSNTVACETLDAMCCVCGAHCATWVGDLGRLPHRANSGRQWSLNLRQDQ